MKQATLYSVASSRIMVATDYHEAYSFGEPFGEPFRTRDMDIAAFIQPDPQMQVEVQRWPVHNVRRCDTKGRVVLDEYIVIDPKLRSILEVPIKDEYQKLLAIEHELTRLSLEQVKVFCALPWYKRVWRALTNIL